MQKIRTIKNQPMNTVDQTGLFYLGRDQNIVTPKFNQRAGLSKYEGWVSACCDINASHVSSQNIKLYINTKNRNVYKNVQDRIKNGGLLEMGDILFDTFPVSPAQKRFLAGEEENKPSGIIYRTLKNWNNDYEEVVDNHPVLDLITNSLLYVIVCNLELTGNAYVYTIVDDKNKKPIRLQILSPSLVKIQVDKKTGQVINYVYGNGKNKVTIEKEYIIHFKYPSNNLEGIGKVQKAWNTIMLDESATAQRQALFDNDCTPSMLIAFKNGSSKDQKKQFEQRIFNQLLGPENDGKMMMVDGDIEVTPMSINPKDLGENETPVIRKMAAIFGVPFGRLLGTNINRSTSETQDRGWLRSTISLILNLITTGLNEGLIPFYSDSQDIALAFDNPVPADKQFEATKNLQYLAAGVYPLNYVKAIEGLPPVEGGDDTKPIQTNTEPIENNNNDENDTIEDLNSTIDDLRAEIERLKE